MGRTHPLEAGVAVATTLSVGMLCLMLASPWLPRAPEAALPAPSVEPAPTRAPAGQSPPVGLYLLRGAFSFGPCLALELGPEAYPGGAGEGGEGAATVLHWERGRTGCDARTGEVASAEATVVPVRSEDDAELVGYALRFSLPVADRGGRAQVEITILVNQSTPTLLQALETSSQGSSGLVFDRVPAVEPTLNPLPSATPAAAVGPAGLYLLRGPFDGDGPCLVLELAASSYPVEPGAEGAASIRWWEPGSPDPGNPQECLTRSGEIRVVPATVRTVPASDPSAPPIGHAVRFTVTGLGGAAARTLDIELLVVPATPDILRATVVTPEGVEPIAFDRVDFIDPPLAP